MDGDPLSRLADIDLPGPPDWQPVATGAGIAAAVGLLALGLAVYLWRRRRRHARVPAAHRAAGRVDALRRRWQGGEIDDREAGYRLAALLRLGLGMNQLDAAPPPVLAAERQRWRETVATLDALRYRGTPPAGLQAEDFTRIKGWIAAGGAAQREVRP